MKYERNDTIVDGINEVAIPTREVTKLTCEIYSHYRVTVSVYFSSMLFNICFFIPKLKIKLN